MTIEGGCFCGALRYAMEPGEYLAVNCHCTMCRRIHAAPYVAWLVVPVERFRYTRGTPAVLKSSAGGTRYFCSRCGTHVGCVNASHPEIYDVSLGSLDAPESFTPKRDFFADTRLPWVHAQ
jgi:hypothetical protein